MLHGLEYLHSRDIVHRDIKLENLLLADNGVVKICDFGWCSPPGDECRNILCGTYEYMAPEVVKELDYTAKVDVWSVGVLAFEMVHGKSPFHAATPQEIIQKIELGEFQMKAPVSESYSKFIRQCLEYFTEHRPSAAALLTHEMFSGIRQYYYRLPKHGSPTKESAFWDKLIVRRSRFEGPSSPHEDKELLEEFFVYQGEPLKVCEEKQVPDELLGLANYVPGKLELEFENRGDFSLKNIGEFIDFDIDFSGPINFFKGATTSIMSLFGQTPEPAQRPEPETEPPTRLDPVREAGPGDQEEEDLDFQGQSSGFFPRDIQDLQVPDENPNVNKVHRCSYHSEPLDHCEVNTVVNTEANHAPPPALPESPKGFFNNLASFFGFGDKKPDQPSEH